MRALQHKEFDALIFDLDDTLLETTRLLTHPAFEHAFKTMRENGLQIDTELCFSERAHTILKYNRDEFLNYLAHKYSKSPDHCLRAGSRAFHDKTMELEILLSHETHETLRTLSATYPLYLVTAGSRPTQKRKVEILEIAGFFEHCFFIETMKKERKRDAFDKIIRTVKSSPSRLLSIGNRLDLEIADAKLLGLKTCHVLLGEYNHITPRTSFEIPDYTISRISEITRVCRL